MYTQDTFGMVTAANLTNNGNADNIYTTAMIIVCTQGVV
jgi:hypothetical protein